MISKPAFRGAAIVLASVLLSSAACVAQETATVTPKSASGWMTIDNAQVVYASGDDVVLKSSDGGLQLLDLKPGTTLSVDGRQVKPSELKVDTVLTHVQVHRRIESDVTKVAQIDGTIVAKNGQTVTMRLDDGSAKMYQVPHDATFSIHGTDVSYADIKTGAKISITAVETSGLSTQSSIAAVIGTPPQSGTLVIVK